MLAQCSRVLKKGLWLGITLAISNQATAKLKVSYGVPEGFGAIEMDNSARFVGSFNGVTLPDFISYSQSLDTLTFDVLKYKNNGVSSHDITTLQHVFQQLDYKQCVNGCDKMLAGQHVTVDKIKRSITIRDESNDYIVPSTGWGLVNNQMFDLRTSSDGYRALNLNGSSWVGLPLQSFGYMNWYTNRTQNGASRTRSEGLSSYYLQKNFSSSYIRAGRQNSIDYGSGSVNTVLSPSFDQFITLGSQSHMQTTSDTGFAVLYSTAEGNYEFYRDGRMIFMRPAVLGRNEISFADLPGGYYPVDIRLVDRNGNIISSETREINNVNFAGGVGSNTWRVTAGNEMWDGGRLLEGAVSRDMKWFYLNTSAISGEDGRWASELNLTRPTRLGGVQVTPTMGFLTGEKSSGGYVNLSLSDDTLGNLMLSRYQSNKVSYFYSSVASTSLFYSYNFKGTTLSYNYQKYRASESQQAEIRWNYRPNGLWSTFSVGVEKGGHVQTANEYSLYFNMTWTLDKSQANFRATHSGGQTQLSGDYRRDFEDTYGVSTLGATVSRINDQQNINLHANRSGSRGDASLGLGINDRANNLDFNYRGMLAANSQGVALGRYSNSGSAMLLKTPDISGTDYGFNVEGSPVSGNSTYAVPLNGYSDISFARVQTNSQDMDMNIEVPANIIRAHPGQVYNTQAMVDINMMYSGFLNTSQGRPLSGTIKETGDTVYPNGLFSILSKAVLQSITVEQKGRSFTCDLSTAHNSHYTCQEHL